MMKFDQVEFTLPAYSRGFHLVTSQVIEKTNFIKDYQNGVLQLFLRHTSASLSINENTDPDVRLDFETFFNELAKENNPMFLHTAEGPDDMPAHIKSSVLGNSVTIPIINGRLGLGTWQGIYLGEHRNHGGRRNIIASAWGTPL